MKRFLIIYSIVTLVIAILLYFVTIVNVTNIRYESVKDNLSKEAASSQQFDDFLKFHTLAYQKIVEIETDSYLIHIYHLLSESESQSFNQVAWFVIPLVEDIDFAKTMSDPNDHTSITISNLDTMSVIYESLNDPEYRPIAISYGIEKYGFYFLAPKLSTTMLLRYDLFDYNHDLIHTSQFNFTVQTYDPENLGDFNRSFTNQEKEDLLNIGAYFPQALIQNYTVYMLVVLVMGYLIFQLRKKKWTKS